MRVMLMLRDAIIVAYIHQRALLARYVEGTISVRYIAQLREHRRCGSVFD